MKEISAQHVLSRLSKALGATSDSELAEKLGVAKQTISTWKKRDKVPLEQIVDTALSYGLSVDSMLFGERHSSDTRAKPVNVEQMLSTHSDIRLAEEVLEGLDEELWLKERGLSSETLSEIFMAMGAVKRLLKGECFDVKRHQNELEDGINYFLSLHYEMAHLAKRKLERLKHNEPEESPNINQKIKGKNHTIAGNNITINKK